jgi:GMP synthase-like glutamine amidotransferase
MYPVQPKSILLYYGEGVNEVLSLQLQRKINQLFKNNVIPRVDASFLSTKMAQNSILAVGGGNAKFQYDGLGDFGREKMKNYINKDNNYLGICAGGYLATQYIMGFLDSVYDSEVASQARREDTKIKRIREVRTSPEMVEKIACKALYWHGPEFRILPDSEDKILVTYQDKNCPAVALKKNFHSQILGIGFHPEIDIENLPDEYMLSPDEKEKLKIELDSTKQEADHLTKLLFSKIGFDIK